MDAVSLRVPGSTSNLGPGFDLLGLALGLFVEVGCEPAEPDATGHELLLPTDPGDRAAGWPRADNLVAAAFDAVHAAAGLPPSPRRFRCSSEVPVARGLGSSGAATAAGLLLGAAAVEAAGGEPPAPAALHALGVRLEGHPDNVTASLYGGCTLCLPAAEDHPGALVQQPVHADLGFAVAWSDATLSTERARAVLPAEVPFADAVENPRRLALLLEGLRTADPQLLQLGAHDRLHHRHRLALIPGGAEALAAAEAAGAWCTAINGSGSSLLAIGPRDEAARLAEVLGATLAEHDTGAVGRALPLVTGAPVLVPAP